MVLLLAAEASAARDSLACFLGRQGARVLLIEGIEELHALSLGLGPVPIAELQGLLCGPDQAQELLDGLHRQRPGLPCLVAGPGVPERLWDWARSRPGVALCEAPLRPAALADWVQARLQESPMEGSEVLVHVGSIAGDLPAERSTVTPPPIR